MLVTLQNSITHAYKHFTRSKTKTHKLKISALITEKPHYYYYCYYLPSIVMLPLAMLTFQLEPFTKTPEVELLSSSNQKEKE